jgi:cell division protein ZapA
LTPIATRRYLPGIVKHTVTIEIAGSKYRMVTDTDETHLERLAGMVNERIAALGPKAARTASPAQILAIVALGLAEDLRETEARVERIERATRDAVRRAIERIDRRLAEDAASRDAEPATPAE